MYDAAKQTVLDMKRARQNTSFDVQVLRDKLWNGREEWNAHKQVLDIISNDPIFDKSQRPFLSRTARYERALRMTNRISELKRQHDWSKSQFSSGIAALDEPVPFNLHVVAFLPVLASQGSDEQIEEYGALASERGIIGCYLQTELGHGTNVRKLETSATYDKTMQEFVINSPTLTSTKWWVGSAGKTSTHGVVQAQLLIDGKNYGPHLFIIQLRSLDDHRTLPNIHLGDIGPKVHGSFAGLDHGFARFNNVRIPQKAMLSKFASVQPNGTYVTPPHSKLSYGSMLYIRSTMILQAGWVLARAATISLRYATVRRQGNEGKDGLEMQIISYPSVQRRLLPILSQAYLYILLGRNMNRLFDKLNAGLKSGDTSLLAETHAISCGLKVLVSTNTAESIEVARRAMGGHGMSGFNGLGRIYADYLPAATYEGDNFVLDQQVTRAALKTYSTLASSAASFGVSSLTPSSYYLRHLLPSLGTASSFKGWTDTSSCVALLERRAAHLVKERAEHLRKKDVDDSNADFRLSKAITEAFIAARVQEEIGSPEIPEREARPLRDLLKLYLLVTLENALADLFSTGLLNSGSSDTASLRTEIARFCSSLAPHAIGLSDAFGLTDYELDSTLGVHDGAVYDAMWAKAQREPLNAQDVTAGYRTAIRPMLEAGRQAAKL